MSIEEPHKRYLVFEYDKYYPRGGFGDLFGSYETIEEAEKAIEDHKEKGGSDFYEIYDRLTGTIVLGVPDEEDTIL